MKFLISTVVPAVLEALEAAAVVLELGEPDDPAATEDLAEELQAVASAATATTAETIVRERIRMPA